MSILRTFCRVVKESFVMIFSYYYCSLKVRNQDIWVFGEWFGNRCCDNCLFFANYIAEHYPKRKLYWIANEGADLSLLNGSVVRLKMDSQESVSILKKASVVIYNQDRRDITLKPYMYEGGALSVNLWHGVPWKHIGLDIARTSHSISKGAKLYTNFLFRFGGANLYVSLSDKFSEIIRNAYLCSEKRIIKAGYPRNALFYDKDSIIECRKKLKEYIYENLGFELNDTTRIITYMPTFRDNVEDVFSFLSFGNEGLHSKLKQWNAILLEKGHYVTACRKRSECGQSGRVFSLDGSFMSQQLLAATDLLITDYSSCFFDYLLLDRPILHYLYDYEYYKSEDRGLYYSADEVACGDVAYDYDQLIAMMESNLKSPEKNHVLREKRRMQFLTYESPVSCQNIYEMICNTLDK